MKRIMRDTVFTEKKYPVHTEKHKGIIVVRDDILPGGSKACLMPHIIDTRCRYVYASPVYGGFQIALAAYLGNAATIFCAKRKEKHQNTLLVEQYGAQVIEVSVGYLTVCEKRAKDFAYKNGAIKLEFGAKSEIARRVLTERVKKVINAFPAEPVEIWCALGSGLLTESIIQATKTAIICAVQVGADYKGEHSRLRKYIYPKAFDKASSYPCPFPSMPNYDRKAWEFCCEHKTDKGHVLFWNVL